MDCIKEHQKHGIVNSSRGREMLEGHSSESTPEVALELRGSVVFLFIFIKNRITVWVFWGTLASFNLNKHDA